MEFTASNGFKITQDVGELFTIHDEEGNNCLEEFDYLDQDEVDALGEYIQRENDERLGRWRWPENPDYVVYPRSDGAVLVLFERSAEGGILYRRGDAVHDMEAEAARAYFEAHPEPKPWHKAKDGHLWLIRFSDFPEADVSALVKGGQFIYNDHCHEGVAELADPMITAARRVWPEGD